MPFESGSGKLAGKAKITNISQKDKLIITETTLYDSLKDDIAEIYNIGDSNGGGIIPNAVYEGYTVGNKI